MIEDRLREHPAPDYWNLSVYYVEQETGASCVMGLRGVTVAGTFSHLQIVIELV